MQGANEFGPDFQRALVRACVDDIGLRALVDRFASSGQLGFTDPAAGWAWRHISSTRRPSMLTLSTESRRLSPTDPAQVGVQSILSSGDFRDQEYVRQQIVEWARRQVFVMAMGQAVEQWNGGQVEEAMTTMSRKIEELQRIQLGTTDRGWFFEELDERQERRVFVEHGLDCFPFGINELDERMHGGLSYGELEIPFGYSGVGKSFYCVHRGVVAVRMRRKVLHFVLEGGRQKIEDRYESYLADVLYGEVRRGNIDTKRMMGLHREYQLYRHSLVLRGYADHEEWNVTIADIKAELADLRSHGWVPDLVIVDYGDLVHAEGDTDRERQKKAFRQLKTLAEQQEFRGHRGYAICAPSQAVRPSPGADERQHVLSPRDMADCYEKARICDAAVSINRTLWEQENRRLRVFLGKYRDNEDNLLIDVETDYARGMFAVLGKGPLAPLPPPPPKKP